MSCSFSFGSVADKLVNRLLEILVEQDVPQGVFVYDHAGLVTKKISYERIHANVHSMFGSVADE